VAEGRRDAIRIGSAGYWLPRRHTGARAPRSEAELRDAISPRA
jgi:hypothetical protein